MTGAPQQPAQFLQPLDSLTVDEVCASEVVVVGSGVAGLTAALGCGPRQVTVLTAGRLGRDGSSVRAQGGIAAAMGPDDGPGLHMVDTLDAGAGLVEWKTAHLLADGAREGILRLLELGARFDRDAAGELARGCEAAHRRRRILHACGDATGAEVMRVLTAAVLEAPHVAVAENGFAVDLVLEGRTGRSGFRVAGALALEDRHLVFHRAPAVVLATGGLAGAYSYTTNPSVVRGDGLALALRAGVRLMDIELVQFHPTALDVSRLDRPASRHLAGETGTRLPLLTEALRGEGAVLIDETGARFLTPVHPDAELAPRDVVARAIHRHRAAVHEVFLDARAVVRERFPERFPTVFALCRERGLDPRHEPLPVTPAAHYHMGGVATDLQGRTSLPGLWACGEVACTGAHGANRLASNSLLEGLVLGARVAADVSRGEPRTGTAPGGGRLGELWTAAVPGLRRLEDPGSPRIASIRRWLWSRVGLIRSAAGLSEALGSLDALECKIAGAARGGSVEERNLIQVARTLTLAALAREESRGGHFRQDFPDPDPAWRCHLVLEGEPSPWPHVLCLHRRPVGAGPGEELRPTGRSEAPILQPPPDGGHGGHGGHGGRDRFVAQEAAR